MSMKPIRILVTGSRFIDAAGAAFVRDTIAAMVMEIDNALSDPRPDIVFVHGGADGVDKVAALWAVARASLGIAVEPHSIAPADWAAHGKYAGPKRNAAMVALGADLCLAFPRKDSKGTWGCIRLAADAGIPVRIHPLPKIDGRAS